MDLQNKKVGMDMYCSAVEAEIRKRKDVTAKNIGQLWRSKITAPSSEAERLGIYTPEIENARQALGFDIYAAKGLSHVGIETPEQLYNVYKRKRERKDFEALLRNAGLSANQMAHTLSLMENIHRNLPFRKELFQVANRPKMRELAKRHSAKVRATTFVKGESSLVDGEEDLKKAYEDALEARFPAELFYETGSDEEQSDTADENVEDVATSHLATGGKGLSFQSFSQKSPAHWQKFRDRPSTAPEFLARFKSNEERHSAKVYNRALSYRKNHLSRGTIFEHLSSSKHPELLDLQGENVSIVELSPLIECILTNTKLKRLNLSQNMLGEVGGLLLAQGLGAGNCPLLTHLNLADCYLGPRAAEDIGRSLRGQTRLESLDFQDNHGGNRLAAVLGQTLNGILSLKTLNLKNNDINDRGVNELAPLLSTNHCRISTLDISWNMIGFHGAQRLFDESRNNTTLRILIMGWNHIGDCGAAAACEMICLQPALQHLELQENKLTAIGAELLGQALRRASGLEYLDISDNAVGYTGIEAIVRGLIDNESKCVKFVNLYQCWTGSSLLPHSQNPTLQMSKKHQTLQLDNFFDHALAEMMVEDHLQNKKKLQKAKINDKKCSHISSKMISRKPVTFCFEFGEEANFNSETGIKFVSVKEFYRHATTIRSSTLHCSLDLSHWEDKETIIRLIEPTHAGKSSKGRKVIINPDEFEDFRYDGVHISVDFEWILQRNSGILSFKLTRNTMRLGIRTKACLTIPSQLKRELKNITDVLKDQLDTRWIEGLNIISSIDNAPSHTKEIVESLIGIGKKGFIPHKGELQLEFIPLHAERILTQIFEFDLGNPHDRMKACMLRERESLTLGEATLVCRYNHNWAFFPQVLDDHGDMPHSGFLEVSYLVARPLNIVHEMMIIHKKIDLGYAEGWRHAMFLRHFALQDEEIPQRAVFWKACFLDGQELDFFDVAVQKLWEIPGEGVLEFDYVFFHRGRVISQATLNVIVQNLKRALSDCERLEFLQGIAESGVFFNIDHLDQMADIFEYHQEKLRMFTLLLDKITTPHESQELEEALALEMGWNHEEACSLAECSSSSIPLYISTDSPPL